MIVEPSLVLAAMLRQDAWHGDRADSPGARIALYWPIAEAIAAAAGTREEAAALVTLGGHETRWARPVLEGRCDLMPAGERCDSGKARGAWQLHRSACPSAYVFEAGSLDSLRAEARCALSQLRYAERRCRDRAPSPREGMFAGYATGSSCSWPPARKRAATLQATLKAWGGAS